MKISNINAANNSRSFSSLSIHDSFYDTSVALIQNKRTCDVYQKSLINLERISGNLNLEVRKLGDFGGVVAEIGESGNIVRYISKSFVNVIDSINEAALKLAKENNTEPTERKKPFQGHI